MIQAGVWLAAALQNKNSFALVGDFELGEKEKLLQQYPQWSESIKKFIR